MEESAPSATGMCSAAVRLPRCRISVVRVGGKGGLIRIVEPRQRDPLLIEAGLKVRSAVKPSDYSWVVRAVKTVHVEHKNPLQSLAASIPKLSFAL
jgi:hypothetical protein